MADMLNVARPNNNYDGLNENSTDEEKLDAVFKMLLDCDSIALLDYDKLFISGNKETLFEAKLIATGLVEATRSTPGQYNPYFRLNNAGVLAFEHFENYSAYKKGQDAYLKSEKEKLEAKENLEMQQLITNVSLLTNQLSDYDNVKLKAKRALIYAGLAVLIAAISLLIQWITRK